MLLLTVLASLALATEDIKRARLEVGAILIDFSILSMHNFGDVSCRLAVDDD